MECFINKLKHTPKVFEFIDEAGKELFEFCLFCPRLDLAPLKCQQNLGI